MQSILRAATRARPSRVLASRAFTPAFRPSFVRTLVTKRYTTDHELVVFDDATGLGTVSITDYAQSSLGDVTFVEFSPVGTEVGQGDQIGGVESVKAASDIYAPVSGTIEEINEAISSQPSLVNKAPETDGWLLKIRLSDAAELDQLLTEAAYKAHCES